MLRALRKLHLVARHVLVGNRAQQMRNAIQAGGFLSSERTMYHGACCVSVASSIASRAGIVVPAISRFEIHRAELPLAQRIVDARLEAALLLLLADLEPVFDQMNAVLRSLPSRTAGPVSRNCWYCSSVQKPMTCSTPARLYQLRSKMTISPAAGKCGM